MNKRILEVTELVRPLELTDFVNAEIPLTDKVMYIDNIKSKILVDAEHMIRDSSRFIANGFGGGRNPHLEHAMVITSSYQDFSTKVSDNCVKFLNTISSKNREIASYNGNQRPMGTNPVFDYSAKVVPNPFVIYAKSKFRPSISSFIVVECIGTIDKNETDKNETEADVLGVVYNSKFVPMGCTVFKDIPLND